jgi:hypothetical protein
MHCISLHIASIRFFKHCPYWTMMVFVEQGNQEQRKVSDSTTFQSQGNFIFLISLDCTTLEIIWKVLTDNSDL